MASNGTPDFSSFQAGAMYGLLKKDGQPDEIPEELLDSKFDDPRHKPFESPMPWLRYHFPKDFEVREGSEEYGPYMQYFDVELKPLVEDASVLPPAWAPNAFFRLSFTQEHHRGRDVDIDARVPKGPEGSPLLAAVDSIRRGGKPMMAEDAQEHLDYVVRFCNSVATFRPRTWRDAFPLVDLLRGVLLYLLSQLKAGQELAHEYALRDALKQVEKERARLTAEHAAAMADARTKWEAELEARLSAMREAMRKQLSDELAAQLKQMVEDRDRWQAKATAAEASAKKLSDTVAALERQVASQEANAEAERAQFTRTLAAREKEVRAARDQMAAMQETLSHARQTVLDALNAQSRQEVVEVVMGAVRALMPGASAYVAELKTVTDVNMEDAGLAFVRHFAEGEEGGDGPVSRGLAALGGGGFLQSPLGAGGIAMSGTTTPVSGSRPTSPVRPRPGVSASGAPPSVPSLNAQEMKQQLMWKYVQATPDQGFMVSQTQSFGTGVSWGLVEGKGEVLVEDVSVPAPGTPACPHFFRPHMAGPPAPHASYLAVPIKGVHGEVVGLLGVDTLGGAASSGSGLMLGAEDVQYVHSLAASVGRVVARDQSALADLMALATTVDDKDFGEALGNTAVDPEPFADLPGGLRLFKQAVDIMAALSDEDFAAFTSLTSVDDITMAVVKSVMAAAGELGEGGAWDVLKKRLSRSLVQRLSKMDPNAAWAEWQALCRALRPLFEAESAGGTQLGSVMDGADPRSINTPDRNEVGQGMEGAEDGAGVRDTKVGNALGRWVNAVRKISAANALKALMEDKLQKANAALVATFQGEGSSALQELRSYRVPPKITFHVLQAVLLLCGMVDEEDGQNGPNWGRMRVATSYKMVKKLTELNPSTVSKQVVRAATKATKDVGEDEVKKESVATLALFRWLKHFLKLTAMT